MGWETLTHFQQKEGYHNVGYLVRIWGRKKNKGSRDQEVLHKNYFDEVWEKTKKFILAGSLKTWEPPGVPRITML